MSEKRFTMEYSFVDEEYVFFDGDVALTPSETAKLLNEQQATINEYKENWNDLVELATKTSLRNVELVEDNARLQKKIDYLCEKYDYKGE